MNTYKKFCPNVFVAKCPEKHEKGDIITLTTKHGKENECIVHNLVGELDDCFLYSVERADGFNVQERAKRKAERIAGYAGNAQSRSDKSYEAAGKDKDFLSLGEPIKVGHHSEKRHRKMFEDVDRNMRKSVEEQQKAEEYRAKAEYWANRTTEVNLSMPESLEYFAFQLEKAKQYHEGLKTGKYKAQHSYSVTYAKKKVNDLKKKFVIAVKLWA